MKKEKQRQVRLHRSDIEKKYYRLLTEESHDIILTQDTRGRIIYVNPAWTEITGYSIEETLGKSFEKFISPADMSAYRQRKTKKKAQENHIRICELELVGKTGEKIPLEIKASSVFSEQGKLQEILLVGRDIRERKKAEKALVESEKHYRSLFEDAPIPLWEEDFSALKKHLDSLQKKGIKDFRTYFKENPQEIRLCASLVKIVNINQATLTLYHVRDKKSLLDDFYKVFGEEALQTFEQGILSLLEGKTFFKAEAVTYTPKKEKIHHTIGWQILQGYEDTWKKIIVSTQDIGDLKQTQASLGASESSYRDLFNSIDDAIYIQDKNGQFLDVNTGAEKLYGIPREEFIGKTPEYLSASGKNDLEDIAEKIHKAFQGEPQDFEFWGKKVTGEIFPKEVHIYNGNYFGEDVVIALARDISEQKSTEAALKRQLNELNILQATAFTCTQATGQDALIRQITNIIGNTLYPDNFGILFLDEKKEFLHPHSYQGVEKDKMEKPYSVKKGVVGKVASSGKAIRLADVRKSDIYEMVEPSTRSELCVPIKTGSKILGVINVESAKVDFFTGSDERLLNTIAGQVATSLEKIRLFETEQKRRQVAEKLQKSAAILTTTLSQQKAIELILEELAAVVSFDSASLQLLDEEENCLAIVGGRGDLVLEKEKDRCFPFPGDNPNTVVIETGQPLILENAPDKYPMFQEMPSIQSWLGVPLIVHERPIGILTLDSGEINHFSEEDARLVTSFANHAAIAVENARLFNAEKTRRQEAETLRQSAQAISSSLNLDEVLQTILASIKKTIPYDSAAIMLLEDEQIRLTKGYGIPHLEENLGSTFPQDDRLSQEIISRTHPLVLTDAQKVAHFQGWAQTDYVRGWMGVPLIVRGKAIGYITLDSRQVGAYREKDAELAQAFAHQAASAIENARLYQNAMRTADRRAVLHRLSQDILRGIQSPDATYQAIHHAAEELMECDVFIISLRDSDREFDEAVYLVNQGMRYNAQKTPREQSIVALIEKEKGSFITKNLDLINVEIQETCFCAKEKIRSLLISPMYVGHELVGVISAQSYATNAYGNEEKILLEMLASYAAAAIENARLFSETERRGKEFAELYKLTQDLIAPQEKGNLLETTLERATHLLGVSSGDIYIYHSGTENLEVVASYGLPETYTNKVKGVCIPKEEGIAGHVAQTLEPLRVDDYQVWDGKSDKYDDVPFTSVLEVPMIYAGNLVGILALYELYPRTRYFTEEDERIMTLFATQVAGAIHSAKQFEQINNRLIEVEAVNRISIALRSAETLEEMFPVLIDEVCKSLNLQTASLWLGDPNRNEVYRVVARGWIKALQPERQADTVGVIGRIYQSGEYHLAQNIADDPYLLVSNQEHALENWAGAWVPVRSTSSVIGVLEVLAETPRKFNENDIRQLTTLAEIFGNAIHRARLYKRTKKQVKRLTTLRNIDTAISGNFDLRVTLQLLVDHAIKQLGADAANILLVSQTDKKLKYFVGNGFNTPFFQNTKMLSSEGIPGKAVREHRTKFVSLPNREISCSRKEWFEEEKFRSYYCAPLTAKGETLGVLEVFHRKPFTATLDWQDFLQTLAGQATIAIDNSQLFEDLKRSNQELAFAYDTTLEGWGKALELRDKDTQGHTLNVTELTLKLARRIGIDESQLIHVYRGALLHDIGKMGIPDNILRKPGPLTKKEWEIMRQHPQFAYDMIAPIPYLHPALDIPYCHHERWDGEGYPRGLKGKEIPLAARIFSIIDVWDALRSDRPYRESWDKKTIIDYIKNESGTRFDPEIVEVFLDMVEEI